MSKSTEDKISSLQTLCADLIICAKQQETIRQRLRDDMRTKSLTASEPPNIKVPVKYAETIGITQAEAVGLANNTQALSARGKALEAVCKHFELDVDAIGATHQKIRSDRVIGLVVLPHDAIKSVFALHAYVARSELRYEDFLFLFEDETVRHHVGRVLNWDVAAIREWLESTHLRTIIGEILEKLDADFTAVIIELQEKLERARTERVVVAQQLYQELRDSYPDKKMLAVAAGLSASTLYQVLTDDKTPPHIAATIPSKTIENVIARLENLVHTTKQVAQPKTPKQRPSAPNIQTPKTEGSNDEVWLCYANSLQEHAKLGEAMLQNSKNPPDRRARSQSAFAIGKLLRIFSLTTEDIRKAEHGEPLDEKTTNLIKGK